MPGGFKAGSENTYYFDPEKVGAVDVILYIPVTRYKENAPVKIYLGYYDADLKEVISNIESNGNTSIGSGYSITVSDMDGYEIIPNEIFCVYGNKENMQLMSKPEKAKDLKDKIDIQYKENNKKLSIQKLPECENAVIWVALKKVEEEEKEETVARAEGPRMSIYTEEELKELEAEENEDVEEEEDDIDYDEYDQYYDED